MSFFLSRNKAPKAGSIFIVLLCFGCTNLFFQPSRDFYDNPNLSHFAYEEVLCTTQDGYKLHGWFLHGRGEHKGVVLFFHGNAGNISSHVNGVLWLAAAGFDVFVFDYRGYGRSEGRPSIDGVHQDGEAELKYIAGQPAFAKEKIIIFGQSLGGAIAIYTAAHWQDKNRIAAVVADSAFSSYRLIAREKLGGFFLTWPLQYPLAMLVNDDYSPGKSIREISPVPLLLLHGTEDTIVPFHHSELLFKAALPPKELIKSNVPGHINTLSEKKNREKMLDFLSKALSGN